MTISLTSAKLVQLHALLEQWPPTRVVASERELRSMLGTLLHVSEIVRPGKFFVRRILNQLGLPPVRQWEEQFGVVSDGAGRRRSRSCVPLGPEFHADVSFWKLIVQQAVVLHGRGRLSAPLLSLYLQPHARTLWSDASGDAMGGYCLESGSWWRFDFDAGVRARVRPKVFGRDDLSINLLELLAMAVTAWVFCELAGDPPVYPGASLLMRGDNSSGVHWVNRCRGGREPRSGAVMRMLGCLEMKSGWCFRAKHVKGVANTLADGISRWDRASVASNLRAFRPDIPWQEQRLGEAGIALITDVVASSTSVGRLRDRLAARTRRVAGLGRNFVG